MSQTQSSLVRILSPIILLLASISLLLAQTAFWVNQTVFDQGTFVKTTTSSLLAPSSRDAISSAVVDQALANRPVLKKVAGERLESLTSGLLGSDYSAQAVGALSNRAYSYTTAENRQDIKIDLTSLQKPLAVITTVVQPDTAEALPTAEDIPDEIVLVESDSFPNLSGAVKLFLWLGPIFWLSALIGFSLYIYLGRALYAARVYKVGLAIIAVALLGLFIAASLPAPIAAEVPNIELRTVVHNVVSAFLAPFRTQMLNMLAIVLLGLLLFNQRFNILTAFQAIGAKLHKQLGKTGSTAAKK